MNRITSRLTAKTHIRQVQLIAKADSAADAVDRAVGSLWGRLLRILRDRPADHASLVRRIFTELLPVTAISIDVSLRRVAAWGHRETVSALTGALSTDYLRGVALRNLFVSTGRAPSSIRENREQTSKHVPKSPGFIQMHLDALGIKLVDLGALLREPVVDEFSAEQAKDIFAALLFPPPDLETVNRIVYQTVQGTTWIQRLQGATRTSATPEKISQAVSSGFVLGKSAREIAGDLLPIVDNVRSSARRIARTESMRVAHGVQEEAWEGLGDLVIGYQIHASLDQNTRPAHAARNGQIYYVEPKGGQLGMDKCPHPPLEADGSLAWNCRCNLTPVLSPNPDFADPALKAVFTTAEDTTAYSDWFATASEKERRLAVGSRRYSAVQAKTGGRPDWQEFISPEGELLPVASLKHEGQKAREKRVEKVRDVIAQRREAIRSIQTFGFLLT